MELQKNRFFEGLTAKYWNHSAKGDCANTDDSEGITLESLGGVFIATLFGLALALVTLIGEVMYYRRKDMTSIKAVQTQQKIMVKDTLSKIKKPKGKWFRAKQAPDEITIGNKFVPVSEKIPNVSYISVFPRKPIHGTRNRFE